MNNLKLIVEYINQKNLDKALIHCDEHDKVSEQYIINNLKGVIYLLKNDQHLAEEYFIKSHNLNKTFEDPINNLYLIYLKKKDFKRLLVSAKLLYEINILNEKYNYQLAYAFEVNNNNIQAIEFYNKCINLNGKNKIGAINNIGNIFLRNNKNKTALNFFLQAESIKKNDKIIINNLFLNYIKLKDEKKADEYYLKANNIDNQSIEFLYNKAEYLILKGNYENAIIILEANKNINKFLIILISLYFNMGKSKEAEQLLKENKDKIKSDPNLYNYLGIRSLYEGNFEDGWKYYEYRGSKLNSRFSAEKEWNGEKLDNKSIVVFSEQGLGDSIQFSKYLIPLAKLCNNVNFVVKNNIYKLFKNDYQNITIETFETIKDKKYDYKISLGSLIKFFYKEEFKSENDLIAQNKLEISEWSEKFNRSKPNVGLVWSGSFYGPNQPFRSIPLKKLEKIFTLDIEFYCLQNEIWERDKIHFNEMKISDFGKYNLVEISSIIENLDLVISADTSILHLSAALNKETWGIFNIYPDWRWGALDKINPYKSLIKINQNKFNEWNDVADEIFKKLKNKFKLD